MPSPLAAFLRASLPSANPRRRAPPLPPPPPPVPARVEPWRKTQAKFTEQIRLRMDRAKERMQEDLRRRKDVEARLAEYDRVAEGRYKSTVHWHVRDLTLADLSHAYREADLSAKILRDLEEELTSAAALHRRFVWEANARGMDVPAEVAVDYPDLPRGPGAAAPPPGEWRYGLTARPAAPGAVPRGRLRVDPDARFAHGVVVYDAPLSDEDVARYELSPLPGNATPRSSTPR